MDSQITFRIEGRSGSIAKSPTDCQVMPEQIFILGDIGMLLGIKTWVKERARRKARACACQDVMPKRVRCGFRRVTGLSEIPAGVEKGMGAAAFRGSVTKVMNQRVQSRFGHVAVFAQVPGSVEKRMWAQAVATAP